MEKKANFGPIPVCSGGPVTAGSGTIDFVNDDPNNSFTINTPTDAAGNQMPGWPSPPRPNPVVPAAKNGVNGFQTVALLINAVTGDYNYSTSPVCPQGIPPKIIVS